ncbi:MAG: DUF4417 domain-containing protein [bacterium]|nr:DUF4417 domain-containing protein [bacterium]
MAKALLTVADGFAPELIDGAKLEGYFDIPCLERPKEFITPQRLIPFSQRGRSQDCSEFVAFYEYDVNFAGLIRQPELYSEDLGKFAGLITPDCSLYRDMPMETQIINTYRSRMVGYHCQQRGMYVIPNVRWSDERSYTTCVWPVKFAFLGIPQYSIVAVSTYGCIKKRDDKYYFKQGLQAMLEELKPVIVLVYGAMPKPIFAEFEDLASFKPFPNWISLQKGKKVKSWEQE